MNEEPISPRKVEKEDLAEEETWMCLDDGTGKNVFYISNKGERRRKEPPNFVPEILACGVRRYYFRGNCVRCKVKTPQISLGFKDGTIAYSLNYCSKCLIDTTVGITKLAGNGEAIYYANHQEAPMNAYFNVMQASLDPLKSQRLVERSKVLQFQVLTLAKKRRNYYRENFIGEMRLRYDLKSGQHISWGFDNNCFDEYFGELDEEGRPHGPGGKFYSDGSIYVGAWVHGLQHCNEGGHYFRSNGAEYEGSWVNGYKHGKGIQTHPDGAKYIGEFAKGYEHGNGELLYKNGSQFRGKFRYGRRDGPGLFIAPDGTQTRGVFRDTEGYVEKPPPVITEEIVNDDALFQPETLFDLALRALASTMHANKKLCSSTLLSKRLVAYLKPLVVAQYVSTLTPRGSPQFISEICRFGLLHTSHIALAGFRLTTTEFDAFLYLEESNRSLESLRLNGNRLKGYSIDLLGMQLKRNLWPKLSTLDLSFNMMDFAAVEILMEAVSCQKSLKTLKLSSCGINSKGADLISGVLRTNEHLTEVNLAFNAVGAVGAVSVASALETNTCLTALNLRSNQLGPLGGLAIATSLEKNKTLKILVIADNKIGSDLATLVSGRLHGSVREIGISFRCRELNMPSMYVKGRFDGRKPAPPQCL